MLNSRQQEVLADKLLDLGNFALASLVFGVVVRQEMFDPFSIVLGIMVALCTYWFALKLEK